MAMVMPLLPRAIVVLAAITARVAALSLVQTRLNAGNDLTTKRSSERGMVKFGHALNTQDPGLSMKPRAASKHDTLHVAESRGRQREGVSADQVQTVASMKNGKVGDRVWAMPELLEHGFRQKTVQDPTVAWNDMGTGPTSAPVVGPDSGVVYVPWNLSGAAIHSNLAGQGPDSGEQSIRYYNIATVTGGQGIDLVVTANSSYETKDVSTNGVAEGDGAAFGRIGVKGDKNGIRELELLFTFYLTGTNTSVALIKFYMTVADLDSGSSGSVTEGVTFYDRVDSIQFHPETDLVFEGNLSSGLTVSSNEQGTGSDNPKDPLAMTEAELKKSIMASYVNQTQFRVKLFVKGGKGGRNFIFAGLSNLLPTITTTTNGSQPTTTTRGSQPTTTTTSCFSQSCQIWADPHVSGFDNKDNQGPTYLAFHRDRAGEAGAGTLRVHTFDKRPADVEASEEGDFWLVRSEPVHIQARMRMSGEFIPDKAAIGAVAVGGPFIHHRTLVVEPFDGGITVDGAHIPQTWSDSNSGMHVRHTSDEDLEIDLPMHVSLKLKRFPKHIDVKITMPPLPGGIDGECGNMDGLAENDDEEGVQSRMGSIMVDDSMLLFATKFSRTQRPLTEQDYQAVAALGDDESMVIFVERVLESMNKVVPPEEMGELMGFAQWYSGTRATQSLEQMKWELSSKSWVRDAQAADAVPTGADPSKPVAVKVDGVSTSTVDEDSTCSKCVLWGASHILSFSAFRKHAAKHPKREALFRTQDWLMDQQAIAEEGTYWLVKTQSLQIQGRFWKGGASGSVSLGALVVSGPMLGGNTLYIRNKHVLWNQREILQAVSSNFSNTFVTAEYNPHAELISSGLVGPGVHFELHNGVFLVVNFHHEVLDARIDVCKTHTGLDTIQGQCGNFLMEHQADERAFVANEMANGKLNKEDWIFPEFIERSFRQGDRVRVREDAESEWLFGTVSSVNPLKVMPDAYDMEFEWDIVEPLVGGV